MRALRRPLATCGAQLRGHRPDGPCTHRDDDVAIPRDIANGRRDVADGLDEHRLDAPGDANRARQCAAVGGDDRRFAGGVDVGEHQRIRRRQDADEILEQVARARVAMRLERQHDAPPGKLSRAAASVAAISTG